VLAGDLDQLLGDLLGDAGHPPLQVAKQHDFAAAPEVRRPRQFATYGVSDALLLQALDPGIGRYLGTLGVIDELPAGQHPLAYAVAGVFAVNRGAVGPLLADADPLEKRLIERFSALFPRLHEIVAEAAALGYEARALVALAAAPPPPDPPEAPVILRPGADPAWIRNQDETPASLFRQSFLFDNAPLSALAAIGRHTPAGWVSRHEFIDMPAGSTPPSRARVMLLGQDQALHGMATDENIPAEGAPWRYRFYYGDLFGRYGVPGETDIAEPGRPTPPAPSPQAFVHPTDPRPTGEGLAPFGGLEVRIPVPRLRDLSAGALRIARAVVSLDDQSQPLDVPGDADGPVLTANFALPQLRPMEARQLRLSATFTDGAGSTSPTTQSIIDIADPRPPPIVATGKGILWTSRPGPSEEVELRLAWSGPPQAKYRTYLADAAGLDIPTQDGDRQRTRAEIAVAGADRAGAGGLGLRERFRLLTDPPVVAGADGSVLLDEFLPRSLSTVQFLRVVPLSERNVEADFAHCGLVPIAVPSDVGPPPPRISATIDRVTGAATVSIEAVGIDLVRLKNAEPGLFSDPPDPGARPPEFRLRRATGPVPDPIYARELRRGPLHREIGPDGAPRFVAVVEDAAGTGLRPFVRYAYWAEIRLPPERRIPPGIVEELPANGIRPTEARQAQDALGAFGQPSAPAVVVRMPAEAESLPGAAARATSSADHANAGKFVIELKVQGAPTTSADAIDSYTLKLWTQAAGGPIVAVPGDPPALVAGNLTWTSPAIDGPAPFTLLAALVDPAGRKESITVIPVTAN
jgi:hypothetical protein